jgi:hypothetical protein
MTTGRPHGRSRLGHFRSMVPARATIRIQCGVRCGPCGDCRKRRREAEYSNASAGSPRCYQDRDPNASACRDFHRIVSPRYSAGWSEGDAAVTDNGRECR